MKKKNIKPLILSALTAAAMAGVTVGGTFALFTDKAETTVNVASGKIDVDAMIDDFKVYSAKADSAGTLIDENSAKYVHEEQTLVTGDKHFFKNDGYATFNNETKSISLQKLTPGDKVAFTLDFSNGSNINILYRVTYKALNENYALVKGLVTTIGTETYAGLTSYQSDWIAASVAENIPSLDFVIEMPIVKGNIYQDKTANIVIGIEAVQGNAAVSSAKAVSQVEEDIVASAKAEAGQPVVLEAVAKNTKIEITATIPANIVAADSVVEYTVQDLGMNDNEFDVTASMDFDIDFTVDGVPAGTSTNPFSAPVAVTFDIGTGKTVTSIKHSGVELVKDDDYTYDPTTGIVTITSTHFSPFSIDYVNAIEVNSESELKSAIGNTNAAYSKISLGQDINCASVVEIGKNVNIIGNKHSIFGAGKRVIRITQPNLVVDLRDLGVISVCTATDDVRGISFDDISDGSKLTMYGCTVSASFYAINAIPGADNIEVTFEKGTVAAGWAALNTYSNNGKFVIKDSTLVGQNDKPETSWNNFNTITFDGFALNNSNFGAHGSGNFVSIINSTVTSISGSSNKQYWLGLQYGAVGNTVVVDNASRILNGSGQDMRWGINFGYYCNYMSATESWTYYENDSTITIGNTKMALSVDTTTGDVEPVITELN